MASSTPGYCTLTATARAVVGDGAVHLADRRRGDRHRVPLGEHLVGRRAELRARSTAAASSALIGGASGCSSARASRTGSGRPWSR